MARGHYGYPDHGAPHADRSWSRAVFSIPSRSYNAMKCWGKWMFGKDQVSRRDFEIYEEIGKGGFSEVRRAKHRATGQEFALKMLNKTKYLNPREDGSNMVKYMRTEKQTLEESFLHPCIVKLWQAFEEREVYVLVMQYCPGGDLKWHRKMQGKQPDGFACPQWRKFAQFTAANILLALEHLHTASGDKPAMIHRDINPGNIVLDDFNYPLLTDFGLAKIGVVGETWVGQTAYQAPEILNWEIHDHTLDTYALGTVTYEMLHHKGEPPFFCLDPTQLQDNIRNKELEFPDGFPAHAQGFINALMVKRPTSARLGAAPGGTVAIRHASETATFFAEPDIGTFLDQLYQRQLQSPLPPRASAGPPR